MADFFQHSSTPILRQFLPQSVKLYNITINDNERKEYDGAKP